MVAFPSTPSPIPGYNALSYRLAEQLVWQFFRPTINRWRIETLGLPRQSFWGPFSQMRRHKAVVINGFSRHVVPPPPDWGSNIHLTGYWYAQSTDWQPPPRLTEFLAAGDPPIFVGFGSMPIRQPTRTLDIILKAAEMADVRLVLHRGWAGLEAETLPEYVLPVGFTDYSWLFPRMAAVVHHGGAGTNAYALRAGVPCLVVPFVFDQFFWGRRADALGVGLPPIPFKQLSTPRLAQAFDNLRSRPGLKEAAVDLAQRLKAEDGVGEAIRILEQTASQHTKG